MDTKRQYEVVFIVDPTADEEVPKLTESFSQIVTDQGGTVTKAETMGKRQLAYEILHHKDGTFVLLEIEGSGREIAELERRMRVNDRVLRYITVRQPTMKTAIAVATTLMTMAIDGQWVAAAVAAVCTVDAFVVSASTKSI